MTTGLFITLEGIEGSGKTTQAALLAERLRASGHRVTVTREPGGTRAGEAIREIFLNPGVKLDVAAELLLVLADRAQHVRELLRPAVHRGAIVLCDRYADSTVAYQGYGRGFDLATLRELHRIAADGLTADLTIVLDCPAEQGLQRTGARAAGSGRVPDRFEGEQLEFHRRVREGFLALAQQEPSRVIVLDSTRALTEVSADIARLVRTKLEGR